MSENESQIVLLKTSLFLGLAALIIMAIIYWAFVFNSKQNIFESMLSNSLSTVGVTKVVNQDNKGGALEQLSQAQFGSQNIVEVKTTITQGEEDNQTKVVSKTIATPNENYSRYEEISTPISEGTPDFSNVMNVWGVQVSEEGGNAVFSESVFGIVLFGNVPLAQKDEMLGFMDDQLVYTPNYDKVGSEEINGRSAFVYEVSMNTKSYAEMVKKYDEILGLGLFGNLNPDDYETSPSINVKLFVDKKSKQLLKVEYEDGRVEEFKGYGIKKNVEIPQSPISRNELETKLQELLQ